MQFTVYLDDDLSEKINNRLKRNIKVSVIARWLLRGLVLTPRELAKICQENEDEADAVAPFLQTSLATIFDAQKIVAAELEDKKKC
jgi:hypothetical protein